MNNNTFCPASFSKKFFFIFSFTLSFLIGVAQTVPPNPSCGTVLNFDGINDYINVPHKPALNITTAISLSAWVKTNSPTSNQYIMCKNNDAFYLAVGGSGVGTQASVYLNGVSTGWTSGVMNLADNNWHYIVATYDGSAIRLYVDAVLETSTPAVGAINTGTNPVVIGKNAAPTGWFAGGIDEVQIWNKALTQTDVINNMYAQLTGSETGLVAYWNFNEKNGTTLNDVTSNAINGTLNNMSVNAWVQPDGSAPCSGGSLDFDGVNDYVGFADSAPLGLSTNFTFEFWMKPNTTSQTNKYIMAKTNGVGQYAIIYEYTNDQIEFYGTTFGSGSGVIGSDPRPGSAISITNTNWHHVAYTYDGSVFKGYLDGVQVFSNSIVFALRQLTSASWYLAAANSTAGSNANLKLDEFRIWNRALCIDEILNNMNCKLTGMENGLVTYFDFNNGLADANNAGLNSLTDRSSTAGSGTLNNFSLIGTSSNWSIGNINGTCGVYAPVSIIGNTSICEGSSTSLMASGTYTSCVWSTGSTNSSISVTPTSSTQYVLTGTSVNGCKSTATTTVIVHGAEPSISISGDTIKAVVLGPATYQWLDCLNSKAPIPGATSYTYAAQSNGVYALAFNDAGCPDTSACYKVEKAGTLDFDGSDDYFAFYDIPANRITNKFTIECWIKLNALNQTSKYVITRNSGGNQYAIIYGYSPNAFEFYSVGNSGVDPRIGSQISVSDTLWHHIAYSYDSTTFNGYLDGNRIFSLAKNFSLPTLSGTNWIVGSNGFGGSNVSMKMDELRIWNRGLCGGEISQRRNCQLNGNESGLVAYYDFSGGGYASVNNSGFTHAIDKSSNHNNGNLYLFALSGNTSNWTAEKISGSCGAYVPPAISISGPKVICPAGSTTLTATNGFSSYAWSNSSTSNQIVVSPATATVYSVSAIDNLGCKTSTSAMITIDHPVVGIVASSSVSCNGWPVGLTASGTFVSYNWSTTATTTTISVTPFVSTTYSVTAIDSIGCSATALQLIKADNPTVAITTNAGVICAGALVVLNASPGFNSYLWNNSATTGTISVSPNTTTVYSVNATDSLGCVVNATHQVVVDNPSVAIAASSTVSCNGVSVNLTANSGFSNYAWSNSANTATIAVTPTATTIYTLTATDSIGCSATASQTIIYDSPTLPISAGSTNLCKGASTVLSVAANFSSYLWSNLATTNSITVSPSSSTVYTLTATDSLGCNVSNSIAISVTNIDTSTQVTGNQITANESQGQYQWVNCGTGFSIIAGANSQSYSATSTGTYAVIITKNGCADTSSCINLQITGMQEIAGIFNVFPNPNSGNFWIELSVPAKIVVLNTLGQEVKCMVKTNNVIEKYAVNELEQGVYQVIFKYENKAVYRTIVVNR